MLLSIFRSDLCVWLNRLTNNAVLAAGSVLTHTYNSMIPSEANNADELPPMVAAVDTTRSYADIGNHAAHSSSSDSVSSSDLESPTKPYSPDQSSHITNPNVNDPQEHEKPSDEDSEVDTPLQEELESSDDAASSSGESSSHGKRKSDVGDEQYIRKDPELYGLRRSVCGVTSNSNIRLY